MSLNYREITDNYLFDDDFEAQKIYYLSSFSFPQGMPALLNFWDVEIVSVGFKTENRRES